MDWVWHRRIATSLAVFHLGLITEVFPHIFTKLVFLCCKWDLIYYVDYIILLWCFSNRHEHTGKQTSWNDHSPCSNRWENGDPRGREDRLLPHSPSSPEKPSHSLSNSSAALLPVQSLSSGQSSRTQSGTCNTSLIQMLFHLLLYVWPRQSHHFHG